MEDNIVNLQAMREGSIPLKPEYVAYNDAAKSILDVIYNQLPCTPKSITSGKRRKAYSLVISSFLTAAQRASVTEDGVVAIPEDHNYWAEFNNAKASKAHTAGRQIVKNTVQDLLALGFIEHVPNSGVRHIWQDDQGLWHSYGIVTQYTVDDRLLNLQDFVNATWLNVARVEALISKPETYQAKQARESRGERRGKVASKDIEKVLGKRNYKRYIGVQKGVRKLNTYWQKHPLVLPPDGNGYSVHCASATRIFHDGRIDCGGRYYGDWTNLDKYVRRRATIDGEATVQIDCNASQLTLLSSLLGMKMEVGDRWTNTWDVIVEPIEGEDKQAKAKQVTMELIGTGNPNKIAPAKDSKITFNRETLAVDELGNELDEYGVYRHRLLEVVPALKQLKKNYYNGAGFLSYHESEIMRHTLSKLMDMDITAYPMHDCIIVKNFKKHLAIDAYRTILNHYVKDVSKSIFGNEIDIIVPITIENSKGNVRLEGYYNT